MATDGLNALRCARYRNKNKLVPMVVPKTLADVLSGGQFGETIIESSKNLLEILKSRGII